MNIHDWTIADTRKTYSCHTQDAATKAHTAFWHGKADGEEQASRMALRTIAMARTLIAAIDGSPDKPEADEIQSCRIANGHFVSFQIAEGVYAGTAIPQRRAITRPSALSDRALAAAKAAFLCAAARSLLPERGAVTVEFGRTHGATMIHNAVVAEHDDGRLNYVQVPDALREALDACRMAFWASGAPQPKGGAIAVLGPGGSATLTAAGRSALQRDAEQNLATITGFLREMGLVDRAENFGETYG